VSFTYGAQLPDWARSKRKGWDTPMKAAPGFPQYGADPMGARLAPLTEEHYVELVLWMDAGFKAIATMIGRQGDTHAQEKSPLDQD